MRINKIVILYSLFFILLTFLPISAKAQNKQNSQENAKPYLSQNALSIAPFIIEESMEKGQTIEREIEISNIGDVPLPLSLSINDFIPVDKEGHVRFLTEEEKKDDRFSLSHWITITEQPEFNIKAYSKTKVKFKITAPVSAEPGTHYGGLLFGYEPTIQNIPGTKVKQKLGALVIITLGKAKEQGEISGFLVNQDWKFKSILEFSTIFKNTGRSRVIPKGEIEIRNWYGKVISSSHINADGSIVLPETERNFVTKLEKPFLLGYYTAESYVQFGNPKQEKRAKMSFWVLPAKPIISILAFISLFTLSLYFGLKRYNRWLIKKVGLETKNQ